MLCLKMYVGIVRNTFRDRDSCARTSTVVHMLVVRGKFAPYCGGLTPVNRPVCMHTCIDTVKSLPGTMCMIYVYVSYASDKFSTDT